MKKDISEIKSLLMEILNGSKWYHSWIYR
jgi:hypothetical protein